MRLVPAAIGVALSLAIAAPAAAQLSPAFEYTSTRTLTDPRAFTLGFSFDLSQATTIDALGYWTGGNFSVHQVAIWSSSGTLLTSGTVSAADPLLGHYRYDSVAPITLAAGSYVIGGQFFSGAFPSELTGVTSAPNFTWTGDRQAMGSFAYPTDTFLTYGDQGIALVNFSIARPVGGVPEPGTWATMLVGFGAIGISLRRRRRAAAVLATA